MYVPPPNRRRMLVVLGVLLLLAWAAGIAAAALALHNAPSRSYLDTQLDGVEEPTKAKQPTKDKNDQPRVQVEGPCWPVYGRTATRTSDGGSLSHGVPTRKLWQVRVGLMEFPPSFCDGVLYVNSQSGFTSAIQANTKRLLWKRRTAQLFDSTPAVSGSRVFIGTFTPATVQALDRATGRELWRLRAGGAVESSPVVVGGLVYATSKDRRVYAIDERTGRVRWAFLTGGEVKDSPSVAGGRVFVANYAAEVFALDARTGHVVWRKAYGGVRGDRIYSSVPIVGTRAYFATVRGDVYAVDTRSGSTRWHTSIPGYVYSTPALSKGRMFIGNYPGVIYAFDAKSGRRLWQFDTHGSVSGSPTVIGDIVYVSSLSRRQTWGLSARTGRVLWHYGDGRYVSAIATDRAMYFSLGTMLSRWTSAPKRAPLPAR